ncbi:MULTISPECIES: hypothetical protein [Streptomonospora]
MAPLEGIAAEGEQWIDREQASGAYGPRLSADTCGVEEAGADAVE